MKSQITFIVSHGETTDPIEDLIMRVKEVVRYGEVKDIKILDYEVKVDV